MSRLLTFVTFATLVACSAPADTQTDAFVAPDGGGGDLDGGTVTDTGTDAPTIEQPDAWSATGSTTVGPAERPARLVAPTTPGTDPAPLVVLLHGYSATATIQDAYLGVSQAAGARGMWTLLPNGTVDASGKQFWNAPGCCDFAPTRVDDLTYLMDLVHEAISVRAIDPSRVYFFGHSNGAFMSYNLACHHADEIAAIAVLAGSDSVDTTDCNPTMPVSVLHLHGTADATIAYAGGNVGLGAFPGAVAITQHWAMRGGCTAAPTMGTAVDLESTIPGAETTSTIYGGCTAGIEVRLDTINGASHIPTFNSGVIGTEVLDWLLQHHR